MDMVRPLIVDRGEAAGRPKAIPILLGWPEKPLCPLTPERPYRKPPQVGGGKYPQVIEATLVKELGNLAP